MGLSWLSVKLGLAKLPAGVSTGGLVLLGCVAGVGFTMALFVAQLAFDDAPLLDAAKRGIVAASALAGLAAFGLGTVLLPRRRAN